MAEIYLIIVILLFVLAVSDLIVGVSNDAVNFLNSAIGSRVATRRTIMIVASIGIFIGAAFSNGMMEVARKGIFNPEFFYFGEVMIIFLAVMLTDILLLDFFNTVALPTSTTVSIVFELLGASVVVALIKVLGNGMALSSISQYINVSQAILIVSGIFISILIAFVIGALVQYFSRLLFTFSYRQRKRIVTTLWTGLAMTTMTYFLLFKGLKGTSLFTDETINWLDDNMQKLLLAAFIFWTVSLHLIASRGHDIFRVVVLFGTFALAMAFAGNDLVNFIGVPIAGFESYLTWSASGEGPFQLTMDALSEPVRTRPYLLILAGLIMIVTLWFSRKARSVTDTEVSLGRQDEGHERFTPNPLARLTVKMAVSMANLTRKILPSGIIRESGKRFTEPVEDDSDKPAFDLVRASVNLTTASALIAFATSLKLPLSTTYVSFMVAMGTSLADRAWGRESAVFRVAGVLNVIGGWFATAAIAFSVSGFFAFLIYQFRLIGIGVLVVVILLFLLRSFAYHRKKAKKNEARVAFESNTETIAFDMLVKRAAKRISRLLENAEHAFQLAIDGLLAEDEDIIEKAEASVLNLEEKNEDLQYELYKSIKRLVELNSEGSRLLIYIFDLEQDMVQSVRLVVDVCGQNVRNILPTPKKEQLEMIREMQGLLKEHFHLVAQFIEHRDAEDLKVLKRGKKHLLKHLEYLLAEQVAGIKEKKYKSRNSQMMFSLLLETKDIVAVSSRFVKLFNRILKARDAQTYYSVEEGED